MITVRGITSMDNMKQLTKMISSVISKHEKGLAKTSMIAFCVIIMENIRIIFYSILDLDMRVWHMFVMNVTSQKHNRIIFLIILECRIEGGSILAVNVNMHKLRC